MHKISSSIDSFEEKSLNNSSLIMKMNPEEVNKHINTIWRQDEIVKFLSERENVDPESIRVVLAFLTESKEGKTEVISLLKTTFLTECSWTISNTFCAHVTQNHLEFFHFLLLILSSCFENKYQ